MANVARYTTTVDNYTRVLRHSHTHTRTVTTPTVNCGQTMLGGRKEAMNNDSLVKVTLGVVSHVVL
jgi:hypothetical protein